MWPKLTAHVYPGLHASHPMQSSHLLSLQCVVQLSCLCAYGMFALNAGCNVSELHLCMRLIPKPCKYLIRICTSPYAGSSSKAHAG